MIVYGLLSMMIIRYHIESKIVLIVMCIDHISGQWRIRSAWFCRKLRCQIPCGSWIEALQNCHVGHRRLAIPGMSLYQSSPVMALTSSCFSNMVLTFQVQMDYTMFPILSMHSSMLDPDHLYRFVIYLGFKSPYDWPWYDHRYLLSLVLWNH